MPLDLHNLLGNFFSSAFISLILSVIYMYFNLDTDLMFLSLGVAFFFFSINLSHLFDDPFFLISSFAFLSADLYFVISVFKSIVYGSVLLVFISTFFSS